jgi:hypothetical protein
MIRYINGADTLPDTMTLSLAASCGLCKHEVEVITPMSFRIPDSEIQCPACGLIALQVSGRTKQ